MIDFSDPPDPPLVLYSKQAGGYPEWCRWQNMFNDISLFGEYARYPLFIHICGPQLPVLASLFQYIPPQDLPSTGSSMWGWGPLSHQHRDMVPHWGGGPYMVLFPCLRTCDVVWFRRRRRRHMLAVPLFSGQPSCMPEKGSGFCREPHLSPFLSVVHIRNKGLRWKLEGALQCFLFFICLSPPCKSMPDPYQR